MINILDYTIESPQERLKLVNQILEENPEPNEAYLETLGDYLALCLEKQEKKEHKLLTENRRFTIDKRELSLEGLVEQFENGENGIYNLIDEGNKHAIFRPKVEITKKDLEEIPLLQQKKDTISFWEECLKHATGREAYICKNAIIEHRKDQYLIKDAYRQPIQFKAITRSIAHINFPHQEWVDENDEVRWSGFSFCDPKIIELILCSYPELRKLSDGKFINDTWYLCQDFYSLYKEALSQDPLYQRIVQYKWENYSNFEIQKMLEQEFNILHSIEYISALWRKKIPKLIAEKEQEKILLWWHETQVKSHWKKCTRCGQIKLSHNLYFSINKSSQDGFYSICKECRNKRMKNRKKVK